MKPIHSDKEQIIRIINRLLARSGLNIDQVVARMQIDGCQITRSTFENRFTTRVHQKPNISAEWLLALVAAFTQGLANNERCRAAEAIELAQLTRAPLELLSEINHFFPASEFSAAIEQYVSPLSGWIEQHPNLPALSPAQSLPKRAANHPGVQAQPPPTSSEDWGEAPDTTYFSGRVTELALLQQWIGAAHCRAIGIFGMSGIGKTLLATRVAESLRHEFTAICWRSLQNAPPLFDLLGDSLVALTSLARPELPATLAERQSLLFQSLRTRRCIFMIDNFQTIMEEESSSGRYRLGYENYGPFLRRLAEIPHRSCVILTSQEKPVELALMEGDGLPVRSLTLGGMSPDEAQQILQGKMLQGDAAAWARLCAHYSGNPLALKLAADTIRDLFAGQIETFLATDATLLQNISELLDQQFSRLALLERELLYWLAIERERVTIETLHDHLLSKVSPLTLVEALRSLQRRSLLDPHPAGFRLSHVVLAYMTKRLVNLVVDELSAEMPILLASFALLPTQSKEYLRDTQVRLLIKPILAQLQSGLSTEEAFEQVVEKIERILYQHQQSQPPPEDYCAGNLLNLLIYLPADLSRRDFSHLHIRQAHLHRALLQDVNFSHATFRDTAFLETFGSISTVGFSPHGDYLATGMTSGEIQLWPTEGQRPVRKLQGHTDMIWAVAFHPDGSRLASGSEDQSVRIWDVASGECLFQTHAHNGWVKSVCFSHNGTQLASGGHDALVRIWDVETGACRMSWTAHDGWVWAVAYSPDDRLLATAGEDQQIRLWDAATGHCLQVLTGHQAPVRALAFAPHQPYLASGSFDHTIKLWDLTTGHCIRTLAGHTNLIWSVAFSPDGRLVASSADDQSICLWEIATGQLYRRLQGHHNRVWSVAFHPNGELLVGGGDDQTLRFWDVASGHLVRKVAGYTNQVWSLAVAPPSSTNSWRLVSGSDDGIVRLWQWRNGHSNKLLQGHTERVRAVCVSPDGRWVASGSDDHTVRIWAPQQGLCTQVLTGHTNRVWSVAFHHTSQTLASASEDQTIRLWEVASGRTLRTIRHRLGRIWAIAFHPWSNLLAGGTDETNVCLWDAESGEQIQSWSGHQSRIWHVAFSPNGQWLASGSADRTVRLWEITSGTCRYVLEGHQDAVWSVAFSPDSQWLASSGDDQRICLWHVPTGALWQTLQGHQGCVWTVAFADNNRLVSGGQDETIRLWDATTGEWQQNLQSERPYERMNIRGSHGLSEAQKSALRTLGAQENP
ncbi:MAG: AAA family ATPase [Caldilineaceae bacterium]|nr:AAA family ATPase [Caldilineaceae bacterium]